MGDSSHSDNNGNNDHEILIIVAANGDHVGVEELLSKGVNVNVRNKIQGTALHWACLNRHFEVVELLIDNGADVNAKTKYGDTPFHYACQGGCSAYRLVRLPNS